MALKHKTHKLYDLLVQHISSIPSTVSCSDDMHGVPVVK